MAFLSDDDWRDLLSEIHSRRVVPIIGPELVTVTDPAAAKPVTLDQSLAPAFAQALGVGLPTGKPPLRGCDRPCVSSPSDTL